MHISDTERRAVECEREVDALKECEYMQDKIGNEYKGKVSSLTNFGVFIELDNGIEGMAAFKDMFDDHYVFDEEKMVVLGERNKKIINIGDELKIQVVRVNVDLRIIDFKILWE